MLELSAEEKLWQNVIIIAVQDALAKHNKSPTKKYENLSQKAARRWILSDNESYYEVCMMAKVSPADVRNQVKLALSQNIKLSYNKLLYSR